MPDDPPLVVVWVLQVLPPEVSRPSLKDFSRLPRKRRFAQWSAKAVVRWRDSRESKRANSTWRSQLLAQENQVQQGQPDMVSKYSKWLVK